MLHSVGKARLGYVKVGSSKAQVMNRLVWLRFSTDRYRNGEGR